MTWILSLLSSLWKPIAAIGGGFLLFFVQRWRMARKDKTIAEQRQSIVVHEAKERSHENDQRIDTGTDAEIARVRHEVDNAGSEAEAAGKLSEGLNDYFGK